MHFPYLGTIGTTQMGKSQQYHHYLEETNTPLLLFGYQSAKESHVFITRFHS
jgi:hypothetical protein